MVSSLLGAEIRRESFREPVRNSLDKVLIDDAYFARGRAEGRTGRSRTIKRVAGDGRPLSGEQKRRRGCGIELLDPLELMST